MKILRIINDDEYFNSNTYLLQKNNEIIVIDPVDVQKITQEATKLKGRIIGALITHGHFDHCYGASGLADMGIDIYLHPLDYHDEMLRVAKEYKNDFAEFAFCPLKIGKMQIGAFDIEVIHTPGHSRGAVAFVIEDNIFTGDTLFKDGVGRYDLFGGSFSELRKSLRLLFSLPNYKVYPGHQESTDIETESKRLLKR